MTVNRLNHVERFESYLELSERKPQCLTVTDRIPDLLLEDHPGSHAWRQSLEDLYWDSYRSPLESTVGREESVSTLRSLSNYATPILSHVSK